MYKADRAARQAASVTRDVAVHVYLVLGADEQQIEWIAEATGRDQGDGALTG